MNSFPRMALFLLTLTWPLVTAGAQQLDCQPCNDHYGRVQVGTSVQRIVTLQNVGTKSLRIRGASTSGAAFAIGSFKLPVDLGAGKTVKMPVVFDPTTTGKNTGTVTITSNAKNPKFAFDVAGVGVSTAKTQLNISPASLDFGNVTVGSSSTLSITLSATGGTVTVSGLQSNSPEYTLPGLNLPLTVAVGQNVTVTVQFAPNASGTAAGKLTLTSSADNSPGTVSLTGVGVAAGSHSADLTWNPSNDPVIGYNVYRGTKRGGPYSQINGVLDASTDYTDSGVSGGATYFYVVTAVNALDQESAPSNEVKVVIPSP
ncbi:MAG TPA: choice-of-anchor D domain-containing protein [Terriglobales bacterium]|jgi:hypothetical protein|nr:choice-of-anchor D domain-containing protein [Terriglobales bacterium]